MTGRLPTTTTSADGRSPAASALWDPDGALLPSPERRPGSTLLLEIFCAAGAIVYRSGLCVSHQARRRDVR